MSLFPVTAMTLHVPMCRSLCTSNHTTIPNRHVVITALQAALGLWNLYSADFKVDSQILSPLSPPSFLKLVQSLECLPQVVSWLPILLCKCLDNCPFVNSSPKLSVDFASVSHVVLSMDLDLVLYKHHRLMRKALHTGSHMAKRGNSNK